MATEFGDLGVVLLVAEDTSAQGTIFPPQKNTAKHRNSSKKSPLNVDITDLLVFHLGFPMLSLAYRILSYAISCPAPADDMCLSYACLLLCHLLPQRVQFQAFPTPSTERFDDPTDRDGSRGFPPTSPSHLQAPLCGAYPISKMPLLAAAQSP
jgi:hypothetical protein